jgi:hypothetical protein
MNGSTSTLYLSDIIETLVYSIYVRHFRIHLPHLLKEAKIGGFGGLQFLEKGDQGIAASPCINHFVRNFTENPMVKSYS